MSDSPPPEHATPPPAPLPPGPVSLRVSTGPLAAPVLSRVVSMFLARSACPLDRLDDALILCDAISAHAPAHVRDNHLAYEITAAERTIELRVAELCPGGAAQLIDDASLPDVGNVIERYSDSRAVEAALDGGSEQLVLRLDFG